MHIVCIKYFCIVFNFSLLLSILWVSSSFYKSQVPKLKEKTRSHSQRKGNPELAVLIITK